MGLWGGIVAFGFFPSSGFLYGWHFPCNDRQEGLRGLFFGTRPGPYHSGQWYTAPDK